MLVARDPSIASFSCTLQTEDVKSIGPSGRYVPIAVAGVRGQGGLGTEILSGQDFASEIQIFKKFFRLRRKPKMIKGDPYLETAASRPRAVLSSANFEKPTARGAGACSQGGRPWPGEGVPVASPPGYSYAWHGSLWDLGPWSKSGPQNSSVSEVAIISETSQPSPCPLVLELTRKRPELNPEIYS